MQRTTNIVGLSARHEIHIAQLRYTIGALYIHFAFDGAPPKRAGRALYGTRTVDGPRTPARHRSDWLTTLTRGRRRASDRKRAICKKNIVRPPRPFVDARNITRYISPRENISRVRVSRGKDENLYNGLRLLLYTTITTVNHYIPRLRGRSSIARFSPRHRQYDTSYPRRRHNIITPICRISIKIDCLTARPLAGGRRRPIIIIIRIITRIRHCYSVLIKLWRMRAFHGSFKVSYEV